MKQIIIYRVVSTKISGQVVKWNPAATFRPLGNDHALFFPGNPWPDTTKNPYSAKFIENISYEILVLTDKGIIVERFEHEFLKPARMNFGTTHCGLVRNNLFQSDSLAKVMRRKGLKGRVIQFND